MSLHKSEGINPAYLATVAARSLFANVSLTLIEIGIHLFMALYGLSVFWETPPSTKSSGRGGFLAISFLITGLTILTGALEASWSFRMIFEAAVPEDFFRMREKYDSGWDRFLSMSVMTLTTVIGDGLLVYRCYIVWADRRWVAILPSLTYLASIALGIVTVAGQRYSVESMLKFEAASTFLTVATNAMVTASILFFLIRERLRLSKVLPSKKLEMYTGVVSMLIESALPLTVFGIMYAAIVLVDPRNTNAGWASMFVIMDVFGYLFYAFTALSPHMIIFRITIGRSWIQSPFRSPSSEVNSTGLDFGDGEITSSARGSSVTEEAVAMSVIHSRKEKAGGTMNK